MQFIDPKTDFAFKKIFGSPESKGILMSFLNALLYGGQPIIEDLEIIDPYVAAQIFGIKDSYLDVKAKLKDGTMVIIEMQVLNVPAFGKRVIYNAAKTYSLQLKKGDLYQRLKRVIALSITDFEMFKDQPDEVISRFVFKERTRLFDYPNNEIELVFIELPKLKKQLTEIETITDKWIYFIKNTGSLESVPETMGTIPEIRMAFEIANDSNLSIEEFDALQNELFFIEDHQGMIAMAANQGMQQGIQQGMQQGIQQGMQQGIQQGIQQGELVLIMRLLTRRIGSVEPDIESRIQQLSTDQLAQLGEDLLEFTNANDLMAWLQVHQD